MRDYTLLTSKYLLQNKSRTILTLIGIIIVNSLFLSILTLFFSYRDLQIENIKQNNGNYEVNFKQVNEVQLDKIIYNVEVFNYGVMKDIGLRQIVSDNDMYTSGEKDLSIDIKSYDRQAYTSIFNNYFHIKEGRLPYKEDEIAIEARALFLLKDKKLGDKISVDIPSKNHPSNSKISQREYVIVGTYEESIFSKDKFNGVTLLNDNELKNKGFYNVFINLKEKKNKAGIVSNIVKELKLNTNKDDSTSQFSINTDLIHLENVDISNLINDKVMNQIIILFAIIIVCCSAIIYNDFNISVIERMEQFGILRSIGATPKQIRKIVFLEAIYMCIIAIPIGFIMGYLEIYSILKLTKKIIGIDYTIIHIKFYPMVILICILLVIITVFASIAIVARKAGKISPVDAIKRVTEIKSERIRKRKARLFRILFNFEGEMAYKNIRRVPKRFWITISSLIVSMILFIVYGSYTIDVYKYNNKQHSISETDARFEKVDNNNFTEDDYKEISSIEGIDAIYKIASNPTEISFPKEYGNLNYEKETGNPLMILKGYENFIYAGNSIMSYYNDNEFEIAKKYLVDGTIDKNALNNMGILLVRKSAHDYSTYKVGDKIIIPKIKSYQWGQVEEKYKKGEISDKDLESYNMKTAIKENEFYSLNVVGIVSNDFLNENYKLEDGLDLIFTEDVYKKINGNLDYNNMLIKFKDKQSREKLYSYFNNKASELGGKYIDYYKKTQEEQNLNLQEQVFIYGVIILITFISSINIINSIGINIMLRKREFASLQAVGMTKGQLTKIILLEGLIHGLISSFISVILGTYLIRVIMRSEGRQMTSNIPFEILLIAVGGALLIIVISSVMPLKKLKQMDIVERLRMK